jgi:hypothetical protein
VADRLPASPRPRTGRSRDVAIVLLLGVVSVLLVSLHVAHYTKLSPIDELQHIDYLYKSPQVVAPGDKVGNEALHQEACRGVDAGGFVVPPCSPGATYDPSVFQEKGYNTAAVNTPLYYSITHAAALLISALPAASDLVDAGRLAGALWLFVGLVLTYFAGRRVGVARLPMLAVLILVAATPSMLFPSATVTPDAASMTAGAVMLWLSIWWEQQPRGRFWVLALGAAVIPLLKMTNVVVACGCAAYFLLRWWQQREHRDRLGARIRLHDYPVAGLLVVAAAMLPSVAWTRYVSTLPQQDPADLPDMAVRFHVDAFPVNGLLESLLAIVNPLANPGGIVGTPQMAYVVNTWTVYLVLSGLVGAAFFVRGRPRVVALGQAWVLAAIACAIGLIVLGYLTQSAYFALAPRYGLSLVPGMCVVTAHLLRHRFAVVAVWALAVMSVALTFYRLQTAP